MHPCPLQRPQRRRSAHPPFRLRAAPNLWVWDWHILKCRSSPSFFFVGCRRRVPFATVKRDGVCLSICLKRLTMAASTFSVIKVSLMSLTPQLQNRTMVLTITFIDTHRAGNNIPNHLSRFDVRPLPSVAAIPAPVQPIPSVGDNIRPNIVHTNEDAERDREVCYTLCMATLWPRSYRRCRLRLRCWV